MKSSSWDISIGIIETNNIKRKAPNRLKIDKWDRYWKLIILSEYSKKLNWRIYRIINCKCDCWNFKDVRLEDLRSWHTKSCWCFRQNIWRERMTLHWESKTILFRRFSDLKNRCNNKNNYNYKNYWWRWIKCEWNSFEEFKNDMYEGYLKHCEEFWKKETTIDRIDNNWNYCKDNCRWITNKEQCNNRRSNIIYKWKNLKQWSEELNINYGIFYSRIHLWWPIKKIITTPVRTIK
jgi:hypothetical protein